MSSRQQQAIGVLDIATFDQFLWERAKETAWPLTFAAGCEHNLRNLLKAAVEQMKSEGVADQYESFKKAEENLVKLVSEMREYAVQNGTNELHESSLDFVLRKLCPIWPFCRKRHG